VGIDVDKKAIAHARANASEFEIPLSRAQFGVGDGQNIPFKNSDFNFVVSTSVLRHVHHPVKMLNEVYRVLKKGGEAWIYDFCRDATDMEINEHIMDVDDRLKRGKMNPTQRSWVTLIMRRQISVESYSVAEITEIVSKSRFRSCRVERDGVRVKIILKK
jgi:ubiquinone/menaquinone biosynthesis C-methylase UbiE